MPAPRPRASGGADLPIGSDAVVQEYQQMQTFRAYRYGRELHRGAKMRIESKGGRTRVYCHLARVG